MIDIKIIMTILKAIKEQLKNMSIHLSRK